MNQEWTVGSLLAASSAYWRGCTLQAGVRLGVFGVIGDSRLAADEIATGIEGDLRGTIDLLDALAAMGLLNKENNIYANTTAARELLCPESSRYLGHMILHHHQILDGWARLDEAVRDGRPIAMRSYGEDVERESFLMGMFNIAMLNAPKVADQLNLSGCRRLLDLGGGPGTYAVHFCLANPELSATIFDRPTTEPFARKIVEQFGLSERIHFVSGDCILDQDYGRDYDAVWLSHLLHSNSPEQCQVIVERAVAALNPGGQIMIHDFILADDRTSPEFAALFSLNMLVGTKAGKSYTEGELRDMLRAAGARNIVHQPLQGPSDSGILTAEV
ncbi:MAG: SAM-dependent methyltransferase [Desulfobulbaceae bacterium]|uniref:SAM-dependent methyltransferase n=1 Tax=Candidatus Desulfatifera sulfidica TaxID=2841691 RepID=A0A8J6NBI7_9BACT|nr:SAM-dependent methyltransferase [Candidatus Desulfatifera sulfidica]